MLIKQQDAHKKINSSSCTVWEYDFPSKNLGFALSKINGRFPETGKAINTECNEIYYVISGSGIIYHQTGTYEIHAGDSFLFEKGTSYYVEGNNLFLALPTSPAWYPGQYKHSE
ncbi:MAG: cupin domain-containing protein [Candidatus Absconditabacterales bacterium]